MTTRTRIKALVAALALTASGLAAAQANALLNVSYDVAREFYKDYNAAFVAHYKKTKGIDVRVDQSHAGSSAQARAVNDGLAADVVTFNTTTDVQFLADNGVVAKDWATKFPYEASPTTSTMLFLVRQGNPKNIKDWDDLIRPDVKVVVVNPKTGGNGRYAYLAAWGAVREKGGSDAQAAEFVAKLYKNVPVLAKGGRDATATFLQRGIGDVLITFESEVVSVEREFGKGKADAVYPSVSITAKNPVAVVERTVAKKGTGELARAYLDYLYSDEAQEIAARHAIRPRSEAVLKKYAEQFKPIQQFAVAKYFGSLTEAQKVHFNDGGQFDKLYAGPLTTMVSAALTSAMPAGPGHAGAATAPAAAPAPRRRARRVLPGFGLTLGYTLFYLSVVVLVPLLALLLKAFSLSWPQFWDAVAAPRVLAAYRLTFGASFLAASVNAVFGLLIAWVLVRYQFPGKRLLDALVDLPFALPTAVAGISLTALLAGNGWVGQYLEPLGVKLAFQPGGVVVALIFIGLPFVVRTVQPVLQDTEKELEEAASSLGATRWQVFRHVILPAILPALLTGFAMAFARAIGEYGSVIFIAGNVPMVSEITPLIIIGKLEQYDYAGATAVAVVMLVISFAMLLVINGLQAWQRKRAGMPA